MKQLDYVFYQHKKQKSVTKPLVYKFTCTGRNSSEKSKCTLLEKKEQHTYKIEKKKEQSAIYEHLLVREHYKHKVDLLKVDNNSFNLNGFSICQSNKIPTVIDKSNIGTNFLLRSHRQLKHRGHP